MLAPNDSAAQAPASMSMRTCRQCSLHSGHFNAERLQRSPRCVIATHRFPDLRPIATPSGGTNQAATRATALPGTIGHVRSPRSPR